MIGVGEARQLLEDVGFLLVPGPPFARGRAYLLVAIRASPTLTHFDPQRVDFWRARDGHGMPVSIESGTHEESRSDFAWGLIRVVDRLNVSNEFVTFGGTLQVERIDGIKVCVFGSDAPILARGGHSQGWDFGSRETYSFLAHLRAAADPREASEARLAALSPGALYAAYVWTSIASIVAADRVTEWRWPGRALLQRERRRLRDEAPDDWQAGVDAACELRTRHAESPVTPDEYRETQRVRSENA